MSHTAYRQKPLPKLSVETSFIDSYFPPSSTYAPTTFETTNIDDIVYRYSSEYDRGTPTIGLYARDGLWDDDETVDTRSPSAASASTRPQSSKAGSSVKGRSRSGTAGSAIVKEDKAGMWSWGRQSTMPLEMADDNVEPTMDVEVKPAKSLRERKSMSRLRGKGRRGELSVCVDMSDSTPPHLVPDTPASFITNSSPALSTASFMSPASYPSHSTLTSSPLASVQPITKAKSTWKRGMEKIFRSKSSAALREAFSSHENHPPVPPLPSTYNLPKPSKNPLGHPFSSSTPPLGQSRHANYSAELISPPPSSRSESFALHNHPSLPVDPFASTLDLSSNKLPSSPTVPIAKPRLSRNSPSLRDLKNFLGPAKPKLTKAKSMANIKEKDISATSPLTQTSFPSVQPKLAKRMSSMMGLSRLANAAGLPQTDYKPPRPTLSRIATESPPLLPPNPPYFPFPQHRPLSNLNTVTTTSDSSPALTPPPTAPLPPLPTSSSVTMQRKGSNGPVLMPRSRSTSMSLKSPPTSSSFYDLYEQLGIWPTTEAGRTKENTPISKEITPEPEPILEVSHSHSADFSTGSWEATISAFPMVDDLKRTSDFDFGDPVLEDQPDIDLSMSSHTMAASSGSSMQNQASTSRGSTSAGVQRSSTTKSAGIARGRSSQSRGRGWSGSSSREDSQDRKGKAKEIGNWFEGDANSSSESEDDDVPLSQLHPDAAAKRMAATRRKEKKKLGRAKIVGRNPGNGLWNGEGGVPAEILRSRLEGLSLGTGVIPGISQQIPSRHPFLRPQRSFTEPVKENWENKASGIARSHTTRRPEENALPIFPPPRLIPSPVIQQGPISPTYHPLPRPPLHHTPSAVYSASSSSRSGGPSRQASSTAVPRAQVTPGNEGVTRSNTTATQKSASSSKRSRGLSNAAYSHKADEHALHARSATEPIPQRIAQHAPAFIETTAGKQIKFDIWPETSVRDVLASVSQKGELQESAPGTNWVLVEVFGELGCERQLREYELLQPILRGWDPSARVNCFVFKQSNRAVQTWAQAIPAIAPYLGAFVQYESKKGKWSKRYLETRGGQVFLSKNEKNKEEIQINTLFHDVFSVTRPYAAPKPFVFLIKRMEIASSFENPSDYCHVFACEEATGWKLLWAMYDAKSHATGQKNPILLGGPVPQRSGTTKSVGDGPLVDLKREKSTDRSAFTGKGLLKV